MIVLDVFVFAYADFFVLIFISGSFLAIMRRPERNFVPV